MKNSSQAFVPVKEVRNGILIMKDGTYRGILMASSVNLALKSATEQEAIIGGFRNFLNIIDFSVQIVAQSRDIDIRPYITQLENQQVPENNELLRLQKREYIAFIKNFTDSADIMRKFFYVIVPFSPVTQVKDALKFGKKDEESADASFNRARGQLEQRMAVVSQGLASAGVNSTPLNTEEVLELLYRSFNPGISDAPIQSIQANI